MQEIPHHLLDVFEPNGDCDARKFADLAEHPISDVISRNKLPIVVGGTGFIFALFGRKFSRPSKV